MRSVNLKIYYRDIFLRRVPIIISLIVGFLLQSQFLYPQSNWRQFRIHGGFSPTYALYSNPHELGVLYATSPGHVHSSSDGGSVWNTMTYSKLFSYYERRLLFDSQHPNRWLIIHTDRGMMHTNDHGFTFSWINDGLELNDLTRQDTYFTSLTQNPFNSNEYLLSGIGIYRSSDRGKRWEKIMSGRSYEHIMYDVSVANRVYCARVEGGTNGKNYIMISTNNGIDWEEKIIGVSQYMRMEQLPDGTIFLCNLMSTDRGTTWTKIKPAKPGNANEAKGDLIVQYAYDAKQMILYAVDQSEGLLKLKQGGDTWELTPMSLDRVLYTSLTRKPATSVAIDTLNDRIYVVCGDSLFVSEKGGDFVPVQTQLYFPIVKQFSFKGQDTIVAAIERVGRSAISFDRGKQWNDIPWRTELESASFFPFDDMIFAQDRYGRMYYSQNVGRTFTRWLFPGSDYNDRMEFNPLDSQKVFGCGFSGFFYVTKEQVLDTTLKPKLNGLTPFAVPDFEFHPTDPKTYYVTSYEGTYSSNVYKTTNGGIDWIKLTNNIGLDSVYRAIALDPNNPNRIYVATDWGIIYSHDDGMTWNKGRGPMPNGSFGQSEWFTGIVVDPRASNIIYASTRSVPRQHPPESNCSGGVWRSTDSGATWQQMSMEGLLNVSVNWLQYKDTPPRLIACTMGGAYEYLLPDPVSVKTLTESPNAFSIDAVYPNPVSNNRSFVVKYRLPKEDFVEIKMLDVFGREVKTLASGFAEAGEHQLLEPTHNLCAGIYFIRMQTRIFGAVKKICLVSDR